jgi:hypothetical protein
VYWFLEKAQKFLSLACFESLCPQEYLQVLFCQLKKYIADLVGLAGKKKVATY